MSQIRVFDLLQADLTGLQMIEASAGTGKTYTLVNLCLRLLVEQRRRLSEILLVTFTEAATQELLSRLRLRLQQAIACLESRHSSDGFFQAWLLPRPDHADVLAHLRQALAEMDLARISTIHAFCQWALSRFPLHCAMSLQMEVISDQRLLLAQAMEDFWRKQIYRPEPEWVLPILEAGWNPECLIQQALPLLGDHPLKLVPRPSDDPHLALKWQVAQAQFAADYGQAQGLWRTQRSEILAQAEHLNGRSFQARFLPSRALALDSYFSHPEAHLPHDDDNKLLYFDLAEISAQQAIVPEHAFFAQISALRASAALLEPLSEALRLRWLHQCAQAVRDQLQRDKKARQQLSFDDLLVELHRALHDEIWGEALAAALRQELPVALIDEFQDTDSLQAGIFKRIYPDGPLFLIGDPKQAIYGFRGADIQAYLKMRQMLPPEQCLGLKTNFRSQPDLLKALELLFERPAPFGDPAIEFVPVAAGASADQWSAPAGDAPLQIAWIPPQAEGKPWSKEHFSAFLPPIVAAEIATWLRGGQYRLQDSQSKEMRSLQAQDIAVLVRTHAQGREIRDALQALRIPCVLHAQESVFQSPEAAALETFLRAVLQPTQRETLLQALASPLLGFSAHQIYCLQHAQADSPELNERTSAAQNWEYWLTQFQLVRQNWHKYGFARMWSEWVSTQGLYRRLLSTPDGERQVANLRHLSELLQAYSLSQNPSLQALVNWLSRERQLGRLDQENLLLQLETDRQAVQILTIHRSKGLEFPVVFCPYLWDGRKIQAKVPLRSLDPLTRHPLLDLGSEALAERAKVKQLEALHEDLRLAYVALTRARYKAWLAWGWVNHLEYTALGYLFEAGSANELWQALQAAAQKSQGTWQLQPLELNRAKGQALPVLSEPPLFDSPLPEHLHLPTPPRIPPAAGAHSFSSLRAQYELGLETGLLLPLSHQEKQDEAEPEMGEASALDDPLSPTAPAEGPLMDFPRGGHHGTFLHHLLETLPVQPLLAQASALSEALASSLQRHGYEPHWQAVLEAALPLIWQTPLSPLPFSLADVSPRRRLTELTFQFPIQPGLRSQALMQTLKSSPRWAHLPDLLDRPLRGSFKGVIDLVFEYQGRYYVLDYKSNQLGRLWWDYRQEALEAVLSQYLYPLQYHLYLVALHRYLRYRLPDYTPNRHLGGALVLFLRGMNPALPGHGVCFEAPDPALILQLSDLFGAES